MGIWKYSVAYGYSSVYFEGVSSYDLQNQIHGQSVMEDWQELWIIADEEDRLNNNVRINDFVWNPSLIPIVSTNVKSILQPLIGKYAEFLPLRWYPDESKQLFAINVLSILDCLDSEQSSVFRSKTTNKILSIDKYVFKKDCVKDFPIFKINESKTVFVSNEFKTLVEEAGLVGLNLEEIVGT